jgi:hypothetical protein
VISLDLSPLNASQWIPTGGEVMGFFGAGEISVLSCVEDIVVDVDRTATGEVGSCLVTGHCVGRLVDESLPYDAL